eukprot:4612971-Alexandrium_andersonii.AAC.1
MAPLNRLSAETTAAVGAAGPGAVFSPRFCGCPRVPRGSRYSCPGRSGQGSPWGLYALSLTMW